MKSTARYTISVFVSIVIGNVNAYLNIYFLLNDLLSSWITIGIVFYMIRSRDENRFFGRG